MYREPSGDPARGTGCPIPIIQSVAAAGDVVADTAGHTALRVAPPAGISAFQPPRERLLLGPGPSNTHPRVLQALAAPTIGHLDPEFINLMDEVRELVRYVMQTSNRVTLPLPAPGSGGMEACIANLVEPADKVAVCVNGVFGARMVDIVERCGGRPITIDTLWGEAVDPARLDHELRQHGDVRVVAFVHAETSTGALSDARALAAAAQAHGCLTIMDAVTSIGGVPVLIDEWGIDAVYSGTQKCLSCPPGLSPVSFSERAMARIGERGSKVPNWLFDMNLITGYWDGARRSYHHTAPINAIYGLREALWLLAEEGLERSWRRHRRAQLALIAGLDRLAIEPVVAADERLPQLTSVWIPDSVDDAAARQKLLHEFDIEIGSGLGAWAGKAWRIGLMGHGANIDSVTRLLGALGQILHAQGVVHDPADAVSAAQAQWDAQEWA